MRDFGLSFSYKKVISAQNELRSGKPLSNIVFAVRKRTVKARKGRVNASLLAYSVGMTPEFTA